MWPKKHTPLRRIAWERGAVVKYPPLDRGGATTVGARLLINQGWPAAATREDYQTSGIKQYCTLGKAICEMRSLAARIPTRAAHRHSHRNCYASALVYAARMTIGVATEHPPTSMQERRDDRPLPCRTSIQNPFARYFRCSSLLRHEEQARISQEHLAIRLLRIGSR
jgi:hypothetical protein